MPIHAPIPSSPSNTPSPSNNPAQPANTPTSSAHTSSAHANSTYTNNTHANNDVGTVHALLVEDDQRLANLLKEFLQENSMIVDVVSDGIRGLEEALRHRYDVVLLDLMLPGKSGIEICRELRRRSDVPIIMLTARGEEADRILGLETGADDYIPKPFSPRELLARVRALLRRARGQAGPPTQVLRIGNLTVEPSSRIATQDERILPLTSYEFSLLYALAEQAGKVMSREQLMERAGNNPEDAFDRSIDVHISRLRNKLGDSPKEPRLIKTVRGLGYVLVAKVEAP